MAPPPVCTTDDDHDKLMLVVVWLVLDRSNGVAGDVDCVATALTSPTPAPLYDSTMYEYSVPPDRPVTVAVVAVSPVPSYATMDGVAAAPLSR